MKKKEKLMLGDNMVSLKKIPDNSIDSVVTDPPYGLSFMGKKWDYDVPSVEFWKEVYRVLKPGGHVLSFGGTRTYHRMVVNIEDAGFEIRDQVMWLYGSGFPKSRNIGKDIEKVNVGGLSNLKQVGTKKGIVATNHHELAKGEKPKGFSYKTASHSVSHSEVATARTQTTGDIPVYEINNEWEGWGTALKPANEPICVARKSLTEKSVALNVMEWGTGGINIDGCRVEYKNEADEKSSIPGSLNSNQKNSSFGIGEGHIHNNEGRFPANLILECICDEVIKGDKGEKTIIETNINNKDANWFRNAGGDKEQRWSFNDKGDTHTNPLCPCAMLDSQSGVSKSTGAIRKKDTETDPSSFDINKKIGNNSNAYAGQVGGASRFFYQAKVSKAERNLGLDGFEEKKGGAMVANVGDVMSLGGASLKGENKEIQKTKNTHPTLKPINLMTYLCRLITPAGGIVLDPFMGSGSTGISALLEGFRFVGMEMDEDYFKIAEARISAYEEYRKLLK